MRAVCGGALCLRYLDGGGDSFEVKVGFRSMEVDAGLIALPVKGVEVVSWGLLGRGAVPLRLPSAVDLVLVAGGRAELGQKLLGWQSKMKAGSGVDVAGTDVVAGVRVAVGELGSCPCGSVWGRSDLLAM